MKDLLFLAYYFPPDGGPGALRAAKFCRYLPEFGWRPTVIAPMPEHDVRDPSLIDEVGEIPLVRVPGFQPLRVWRQRHGPDTGRAQVTGGGTQGDPWRWLRRQIRRYLMVPDEGMFWLPWGIRAAVRKGETLRPRIVLATQPNSLLLGGAGVAAELGVPLVTDFRDEWTRGGPSDDRPWLRRKLEEPMEAWVVRRSAAVVCNTPGMRRGFRRRYPDSAARMPHLPNGYDPEDYPPSAGCRTRKPSSPPAARRPLDIVYAGALYADYNPNTFLRGVGEALARGRLPGGVRLRFYGHHDRRVVEGMEEQARSVGLGNALERPGHVPHRDALEALVEADLILVLLPEGTSSASRITAKTYEALAAGRPLLALMGPGDARDLVEASGAAWSLLSPGDVEGVAAAVGEAARALEAGTLQVSTDWEVVGRYERRAVVGRLAALLDEISDGEAR